MTSAKPDTEELLGQVSEGDASARGQLLARHRQRLRNLIAWRLDRRLAPRIDPSDVVQEVLVEADAKLDKYIQKRPLPFYPWLRELACERVAHHHRRHVHAQKRSVRREERDILALPDDSIAQLAKGLASSISSPSQQAIRKEERLRVQHALTQLPERDREILVLRHLEQLNVAETAAVLGINEGAVKTRHVRALERLRGLLEKSE